MAEKLPEYTWAATVLTTKGTKKVVYSTVTGKVVGEIRDGKFVQTVDSIPKPTKKSPRTVTAPETAVAGGVKNTIASYERDAAYFKTVAEDIDNSPAERAKARNDYNNAQKEIAKLKGQDEEFTEKQKSKESSKKITNARKQFESLKEEYQGLKQQFDALIDPKTDPKASQIKTRMNQIVNNSLDVYKIVSGKDTSVKEVTSLLSGQKAAATTNAPTGPTALTSVETNKPTGTPAAATTATAATRPATTTSKPTTTTKPTAVAPGFNVGSFRAADEASMAKANAIAGTPGGTPAATTGNKALETILGSVEQYFDLPDYIFRLDDDLGKLLVRAVNEKWTEDRWNKEIENTNWWRKNSAEVRRRLTQFGNYEDLRSQGQDVSRSDYGLWLSKKKSALKADARTIAGVAITDQQAEDIAKKIYLGFLDDDENAIRAFLVPFISKTPSIVNGQTMTGFGGKALQDYQTLQGIAKANGLSLKDILPNISTALTGGDLEEAVLEKIALGEVDIGRISQDARMLAAIGQPEFVRGLLSQGYDLDQVYAPYKNVMANVLELNPEEISLNDPSLRNAISDKGEVNLYDFQRALRKDSRWQYTQNAREEVSNSVLGVLRDFGFQG